jgi:UDP-glucose 4-epimerase
MADRETKRIVVLGGLGFIGSHLCRALVNRGDKVRVFSKLYGSRELVTDIESDLEIFEADIMQPREVLDVIGDSQVLIDLVHTTRPGSSMRDPEYDVTTNVAAHVKWLRSLGETRLEKVIFISSGGTVYGPPQAQPIDEDHPTEPVSSYGITKLALEKYFSMYANLAGIRCTILRPSNVYGPGNRLNVGQGVIGVLADRALKGQTLEVWGTGESRRDYLYIDDLIAAFLALIDYEGTHSVFNVSSGSAISVLDIIDSLRVAIGEMPEIVHLPSTEFDVGLNVLSSARLTSATGWRPQVSLGDGIPRLIEWLRAAHVS